MSDGSQVCAWRRFGRHTTEGYGWLSLNSEAAAAQKVFLNAGFKVIPAFQLTDITTVT